MSLGYGVGIGDWFCDEESGVKSQIGNIMVAVQGDVLVAFREEGDKRIQHERLYEFAKGKKKLKKVKE